MIPNDSSRAFAILVNNKIVEFAATDTAPIPSGGRILPVINEPVPARNASEIIIGPEYRIESDSVVAYYRVELI